MLDKQLFVAGEAAGHSVAVMYWHPELVGRGSSQERQQSLLQQCVAD